MALIIIAGLLGVFGTSPLSAATAGSDAAVVVHYQRFVRHQGEDELILNVGPNQANEGQIELWLSTGYLGEIDL